MSKTTWKELWNKKGSSTELTRYDQTEMMADRLCKAIGMECTGAEMHYYLLHIALNLSIDKNPFTSAYEIGCGNGIILAMLEDLDYVCKGGFDVSENLINDAKIVIPHMADKFTVQDANDVKNLEIENADFIFGTCMVHYLNNLSTVSELMELMLSKANKSIAFFDVPDIKRIEESEAYRREYYGDEKYKELYTDQGLTHLYFDMSFFNSFAIKHDLEIKIMSKSKFFPSYVNAKFRYDVILEKR